MKIYFGHPKDGVSESPELRALGLHFNKAAPSNLHFIGLHNLNQPGYESYLHNLAAFLFANDTKKKQKLGQIGYPIRIGLNQSFPVSFPPVTLRIKSPPTEFLDALNKYEHRVDSVKRGEDPGKLYVVTPSSGFYQDFKGYTYERHFPTAGQVDLKGYLALGSAVRIFSSLFRVHKYPAYTEPSEKEDYDGHKRRIEEGQQEGPNKRRRGNDGTPVGEEGDIDMDPDDNNSEDEHADQVVLRFAKPQDDAILPWGSGFGDIPTTYGMVFPYVRQLSNWDKDTVPRVLERFFIRCFGTSDKKIITAFSEFCEAWKRSAYSSPLGIELSHMAKVIEIGLNAQARVFPIFEHGKTYRGCYLSGANFSVGLKDTILRPVPFEKNEDDLRALFGHNRFLYAVRDACTGEDRKTFEEHGTFSSLREIHDFLDENVTLSAEQIELLRSYAVDNGFHTSFFRPTVENLDLALTKALKDQEVPSEWPMHYEGFLKADLLEIALSAFGPLVPTPHIPGCKMISNFRDVPTNSVATFRRCSLESATVEWKEAIKTGVIYNEPKTLNARYQYVKLRGMEEKRNFYGLMKKLSSFQRNMEDIVGSRRGAESGVREDNDGGGSEEDLFSGM